MFLFWQWDHSTDWSLKAMANNNNNNSLFSIVTLSWTNTAIKNTVKTVQKCQNGSTEHKMSTCTGLGNT